MYAIRFGFPELTDPLYAGRTQDGALGWAPTLASALTFSSVEDAQRMIDNGYGETAPKYAEVIEVPA